MTIAEIKRQARAAEWAEQIRAQQDSGMSIKAWCAGNGCREGRYYYWLRIVRTMAIERVEQAWPGAALVRVEPEGLASSTATLPIGEANGQVGIAMRYGQATLEFSAGTPVRVICELLRGLNAP